MTRSALLAQMPSLGDSNTDVVHVCKLQDYDYAQVVLGNVRAHWGLSYTIVKPTVDFSSVEIRQAGSYPCQSD